MLSALQVLWNVYSVHFLRLACSSIDSCDHNLWVYLEAERIGCKRCTGAIPSCAVEIDESGTKSLGSAFLYYS